MSLTAAAKKEALKQQTPTAFIPLLEIYHEDLATPIRICANRTDIVSNGNTFTALAFSCTLAEDRKGTLPQATVVIDNTSRLITQQLEQLNPFETITAVLSLVSTLDLDAIEGQQKFILQSAEITRKSVRFAISYNNVMSNKFPAYGMTPDRFKAIS